MDKQSVYVGTPRSDAMNFGNGCKDCLEQIQQLEKDGHLEEVHRVLCHATLTGQAHSERSSWGGLGNFGSCIIQRQGTSQLAKAQILFDMTQWC